MIEAQGKATAESMLAKADSFKQYNEAAVIQMLIEVLPVVAAKISEPLSKTEKIVIINSGNGPGGGASKLTGDVTAILSQLPPVVESLTGMKLDELLKKVPGLVKSGTEGKESSVPRSAQDSGSVALPGKSPEK